MPSTTRGPLPTGTYWRRRLALLSVALVLVLAFGKVLTHFSDGSGGNGGAAQSGATTTSSFPPPDTSTGAATGKGSGNGNGRKNGKGRNRTPSATPSVEATPTLIPTPTPTPTPTLADPDGTCDDDDVYITPTVTSAVAGSPVTITLNLQTQSSEACTWQVSPDSVTMKIVQKNSGTDTVWTSAECPKVVPTQDVVVRSAVATQVAVTWDTRRSVEYCTGRGAYALPGTYDVYAAALAGEPTDVQFDLTTPVPAQVTETVTPTPTPTPTPTAAATKSGKNKHKND